MRMISAAVFTAAVAIGSPASANTLPCLVGDANEMLAAMMKAAGQRPVMKFELENGTPVILLGKPDGEFTLVVLLNGMTCVLAAGHGMAPAALDLKFPVAELPGKPS